MLFTFLSPSYSVSTTWIFSGVTFSTRPSGRDSALALSSTTPCARTGEALASSRQAASARIPLLFTFIVPPLNLLRLSKSRIAARLLLSFTRLQRGQPEQRRQLELCDLQCFCSQIGPCRGCRGPRQRDCRILLLRQATHEERQSLALVGRHDNFRHGQAIRLLGSFLQYPARNTRRMHTAHCRLGISPAARDFHRGSDHHGHGIVCRARRKTRRYHHSQHETRSSR